MSFAVSLTGYAPSPRFDGVKWTLVHVFEATASDGPWTDIETLTVTTYPDAAAPPVMGFTTTLASAESGLYYRLQFEDANGVLGPFSAPVLNSGVVSTVPSAAEIRAEWAQAPLAEWGYPAPTAGQFDGLDLLVAEATSEFQSLTTISPTDQATTDAEWAPLVRRAIRMLTVYNAGGMQPEVLDSIVDFDVISNLSISSYSETRRNIGSGRGVLHPWPALNKLLETILAASTGTMYGFGSPGISSPPDVPIPGEKQIYGPYPRRWSQFQRPFSPGAIPV